MSDVTDVSLKILENIQSEIRGMRDDIHGVNKRLDVLTGRLDILTVRVDTMNVELNARIDRVIEIVGTHHQALESRVPRVEDHLELPHEP